MNKVLSKKRQIHSVSRHFFFHGSQELSFEDQFLKPNIDKIIQDSPCIFPIFKRKKHGDFAPWDRWDEHPVGLSSL
jgi:hypothetical protein